MQNEHDQKTEAYTNRFRPIGTTNYDPIARRVTHNFTRSGLTQWSLRQDGIGRAGVLQCRRHLYGRQV